MTSWSNHLFIIFIFFSLVFFLASGGGYWIDFKNELEVILLAQGLSILFMLICLLLKSNIEIRDKINHISVFNPAILSIGMYFCIVCMGGWFQILQFQFLVIAVVFYFFIAERNLKQAVDAIAGVAILFFLLSFFSVLPAMIDHFQYSKFASSFYGYYNMLSSGFAFLPRSTGLARSAVLAASACLYLMFRVENNKLKFLLFIGLIFTICIVF